MLNIVFLCIFLTIFLLSTCWPGKTDEYFWAYLEITLFTTIGWKQEIIFNKVFQADKYMFQASNEAQIHIVFMPFLLSLNCFSHYSGVFSFFLLIWTGTGLLNFHKFLTFCSITGRLMKLIIDLFNKSDLKFDWPISSHRYQISVCCSTWLTLAQYHQSYTLEHHSRVAVQTVNVWKYETYHKHWVDMG